MSPPGRPASLKQRLLLSLLGGIAVVWLATAIVSYFDARHELDELLDAHLAQSVSLLVAQMGHELEEIDADESIALAHKRGHKVAIQVWEQGDKLRLHSASAPNTRLSAQDEGYSDAEIDGKRWRVFSAWDGDRSFLIQVGEHYEARNEIAVALAKNMLLPLLLALPVLGILVWLLVARGLRPLALLGGEVARREPGNLLKLDTAGIPAEVMPLVASLNRLFERVSQLIDAERRFTADASHELRTPIAALKTQAQVARAASADAERAHALDNVIAGCDRAAHLLEQLLTLARLDPEEVQRERSECDLRELAQAAIADLAPYAVSKKVDIGLAEGAPVRFPGYPGLVAILLRNLIDNAIRYSPAGASVRVAAGDEAGAAAISVTDEGPGIGAEEREKVGQRFYRILGSGESGSGLGLSIVKRIAELHGATLALRDNPAGKGLLVLVRFPRESRRAS